MAMAEKFGLSRKGEPDMKRLMFLGASFAAFAVSAAEYTWVNGSENWDSPASYRDSLGNVPDTPPGGGDSLKIVSSAVEIAAGDSAALNRLNSIGYLTLSSSTLALNCNADMELKCGLYSDKDESACVVKTGDGALVLSAKGKSPSDEGCYYDAYVDFDIHEGVLKFYQGLDLDGTMCVRDVSIGAEAACWMVSTKKLMIENLRGEGPGYQTEWQSDSRGQQSVYPEGYIQQSCLRYPRYWQGSFYCILRSWIRKVNNR